MGYSERSCLWKVGVFQAGNTIPELWKHPQCCCRPDNAQGVLLNRELKVTNAALFSEHRKQCSALHKCSYFISVVKTLIKEIHGNSGCWAPQPLTKDLVWFPLKANLCQDPVYEFAHRKTFFLLYDKMIRSNLISLQQSGLTHSKNVSTLTLICLPQVNLCWFGSDWI